MDRDHRGGDFRLGRREGPSGAALDNPALRAEGRVTLVGGLLAVAVLAGLLLNTGAGMVVG